MGTTDSEVANFSKGTYVGGRQRIPLIQQAWRAASYSINDTASNSLHSSLDTAAVGSGGQGKMTPADHTMHLGRGLAP